MTLDPKTRDTLCINTIRMLAADAVQKANSGHPGAPMGLAPLGYLLWTRFLKHHPANPQWPDRDRFVLSAGHASMLLYSLLHLTGYDLSLDELKNFRQWGSLTPGHPEYGLTPGVETTTGPLGQGFANAVGMALTERILAARFNRPDHSIVDHRTYVIAGDGDMMEGITSEAASFAGHLGLGKLICFYDDNKITIEGGTGLAFSEDVGRRFEAYGWQVLHAGVVSGADDLDRLSDTIRSAQAETGRPSLIIVRTHIGYGSPNRQDTASAHGAPLGEEEVRLTKEKLGWPTEPAFQIPEDVKIHFLSVRQSGAEAEAAWRKQWNTYQTQYPGLAQAWEAALARQLPEGCDAATQDMHPEGSIATRKSSGAFLNAVAKTCPTLIGGSADLAPSNNTELKGMGDITRDDFSGRNLRFGVREHAMGGILNGMALHGGLMPYGGTFLVFSDYMKPAIRLAALMGLPVIYVFTHDSIGLGEDGPTHQPVEHLAALRAVPNLCVIRPADALETLEAWRVALHRTEGPTALVLTRQSLPVLDRTVGAKGTGLEKGAYILWETPQNAPELILIASGSEVQLALEAGKRLASEGRAIRVVSMPSWECFEAQPEAYRQSVLPPEGPPCLAIEAAAILGWERYAGKKGAVIGLGRFGASAPYGILMDEFGLTVQNIVSQARALLK
ncbi:MAG: transketolase [Nitrospiria bacterium]